MSEQSFKRKRPPTFHHLQPKRAKKLKQIWVANTKIKSKWKAEKRREAVSATAAESGENAESTSAEQSTPVNWTESPPAANHQQTPKIISPARQNEGLEVEVEEQTASVPSLRDLARRAYSRSSLHTFKSGSSRRGNSQGMPQSRGTVKKNQRHEQAGRGQPNMKLRMDVLLEKIKQDFA